MSPSLVVLLEVRLTSAVKVTGPVRVKSFPLTSLIVILAPKLTAVEPFNVSPAICSSAPPEVPTNADETFTAGAARVSKFAVILLNSVMLKFI